MEIVKKKDGSTLTVLVEGRIDTVTAPELEEAVSSEYEAADALIIDLEKVTYISSAGLRVLLSAQKAMKNKGGMKVTHVCESVEEIFSITGFMEILTIE